MTEEYKKIYDALSHAAQTARNDAVRTDAPNGKGINISYFALLFEINILKELSIDASNEACAREVIRDWNEEHMKQDSVVVKLVPIENGASVVRVVQTTTGEQQPNTEQKKDDSESPKERILRVHELSYAQNGDVTESIIEVPEEAIDPRQDMDRAWLRRMTNRKTMDNAIAEAVGAVVKARGFHAWEQARETARNMKAEDFAFIPNVDGGSLIILRGMDATIHFGQATAVTTLMWRGDGANAAVIIGEWFGYDESYADIMGDIPNIDGFDLINRHDVCIICGKPYTGYGYDAGPIILDGRHRVCGLCDGDVIMPLRKHIKKGNRNSIVQDFFLNREHIEFAKDLIRTRRSSIQQK